jgi:hypothetical protein
VRHSEAHACLSSPCSLPHTSTNTCVMPVTVCMIGASVWHPVLHPVLPCCASTPPPHGSTNAQPTVAPAHTGTGLSWRRLTVWPCLRHAAVSHCSVFGCLCAVVLDPSTPGGLLLCWGHAGRVVRSLAPTGNLPEAQSLSCIKCQRH